MKMNGTGKFGSRINGTWIPLLQYAVIGEELPCKLLWVIQRTQNCYGSVPEDTLVDVCSDSDVQIDYQITVGHVPKRV